MYYNVLEAKELADLGDSKFNKEILMENNESCLSVISIKKEEIIDTHTSNCNTAVYVIEGKIEIHFSAEKFTLDKGEIIMFKRDDEHKVVALKDSKFFLIKI